MKCPHCLDSFFEQWTSLTVYLKPGWAEHVQDVDGRWLLDCCMCASCKRAIIRLSQQKLGPGPDVPGAAGTYRIVASQLVRPKSIAREPLASEVPAELATDYREACLVLADSPKASAALSRRCLQALLSQKGDTSKRDLAEQIQEVLDSRQLPSYLADGLDAVRIIGNFASHPIKSTNTGEIIEIESGEAEWNLDVLEGLFDFYFVQPMKFREKKERLNEKLQDAGKPPMKTIDG